MKKNGLIYITIIIIIIIISCYPLWASTKRCHLVLSLAILFTSLHLFPFANASLWTDLRHVCFGLPLLLFPCGFQSKTSLSMASFHSLSVCPIQVHFRLFICINISVPPVLLLSSSFEIHHNALLKYLLRLPCICYVLNIKTTSQL
jgi:hypothetical protein